MSYLIKELPDYERPRERFKKYGPSSLSNEELISILLRTGTKNKSVREVSTDILKEVSLHELSNIHYKTLSKIKGVGDVKSITLLSAVELGKRILNYSDIKLKLKTQSEVFDYVRNDMEGLLQEKFMVIYLDNKSYVIQKKIIFMGTVNYSLVVARDIFREGVKCNATSMILIHNHPGGSIEPSLEDCELTEKIIKLGHLMEIPVMEHMIIGNNRYYSFREYRGDLFAKKINNYY